MLMNNRSIPDKREQHNLILDNDGAERLAIAIVKQAADDYEHTLRKMLRHPTFDAMRKLKEKKAECESFFLSPWFEMLVNQTDGKALMKQIQKNAVRKEREAMEQKLEKAKKKMSKKMQKGE